MLRLCFHSFYQIKIKHNLVVQIFTAENAFSPSRYIAAMEKKAVTTCCMLAGVLSLRLCD